MINIEKNYIKNVATQKFMSRHNEELKTEILSVTLIEEKRPKENCRMSQHFLGLSWHS